MGFRAKTSPAVALSLGGELARVLAATGQQLRMSRRRSQSVAVGSWRLWEDESGDLVASHASMGDGPPIVVVVAPVAPVDGGKVDEDG